MVLRFTLLLLVGLTLSAENNGLEQHAISYNLGGDRFGDKVLGYVQARYLSYITSIPFLYRPFIYSDQLIIDNNALPYDLHAHKYGRQFHIASGQTLTEFFHQIQNPQSPPTLFIVDFFPSDISEWDGDTRRTLIFNHPWHNTAFANYMKNILQPRIPVPNFTCKDRLNVAVHVRTLSGTDTADTSWAHLPLKHPALDYYERQINKVYEWNSRRPMYVFLFSDTNKPLDLVGHFRKRFQGSDIVFDIQILTRPDLNNTVQDFFAMQQFSVLVATQSNFSMMAARMGAFDMVLFPIHVQGAYPHYRIDRVQVISKKSSWFPYELNIILRD